MKTEMMKSATRMFGKVKLSFIKHSPTIAVVSGIALMAAGAVMACKSSMKVNEVLDDAKGTIEVINKSAEDGKTPGGVPYSQDDRVNDLKIQYTKTAVELVKLYAIPAVLFGSGVACVVAGHKILNTRNAALASAYTGLKKAYDQFEDRVKEKYGEEEAKSLKYGIKALPVSESGDGSDVSEEKTVQTAEDHPSEFARFFDESSRYYSKDAHYNKLFLQSQQAAMNNRLISQGYLFLNDVLSALGFDPTPEGQIMGWLYNEDDDNLTNWVDFGLYDIHRRSSRNFINENDPCVLLDFNVDGNILNEFKKYERK